LLSQMRRKHQPALVTGGPAGVKWGKSGYS
jgi:hypothetical protein